MYYLEGVDQLRCVRVNGIEGLNWWSSSVIVETLLPLGSEICVYREIGGVMSVYFFVILHEGVCDTLYAVCTL